MHLQIGDRKIGSGEPTFIVAEMSANHGQDFDRAVEIVRAAKEAGADAVKLQTYTADTLTLDCDSRYFKVEAGTPWGGRRLYDLYREASTPWEWHGELKAIAAELGLILFSTPFDSSAVEFLEGLEVPAYKIASFELVDLPLIREVAATGRPMIMSTGMATCDEIEEAIGAARSAGCQQLALLKCTSAYPAPSESMNLRTIPDLQARFDVVTGLSDHSLELSVPVAAVSLGASIVEKHFTLTRDLPGPDSAFSLEPAEFRAMVEAVRQTEAALGEPTYGVQLHERPNDMFRRSLFVTRDIKAGEPFTERNVKSIRPAHGLHTRHLEDVLRRTAAVDIARGTPLKWEHIQ